MGVIKQDVRLPAEPGRLWDVFADLRRLPDWLTMHVRFKSEVPGPQDYQVGIKVTQVVTLMGMPNTVEWTVEEYRPLELVKISGTGMAGVKVSFAFGVESAGGWTTGSLDAEFTGQIIVGALGKAVEKEGAKQLRASLEKLADLLLDEGVLTAEQRERVEIVTPEAAAAGAE